MCMSAHRMVGMVWDAYISKTHVNNPKWNRDWEVEMYGTSRGCGPVKQCIKQIFKEVGFKTDLGTSERWKAEN